MDNSPAVLLFALCALLFANSNAAQAQELDDKYEKVLQDVRELKKQKESLEADTLGCCKLIGELRDSMARQQQVFEQAEATLEELSRTLDKKAISNVEQEVAALEQEYEELQQARQRLHSDKQQKEEQLADLNVEVSALQQTAQQPNEQATEQPVDQTANVQLFTKPAHQRLYDEGTKLLNEPYNADRIKKLRTQMLPLIKDKNKTPLKPGEFVIMDSLDIKLSRFKNGVKELQNLMRDVKNDATIAQLRKERNEANRTACVEAIRPYIIPEAGSERERIHKRYFELIPYLQQKLRSYWDELNSEPYAETTPTEREIMKYNIK